MADQVEKCIMNNLLFSENTSNLEGELKDDDFVDAKVVVCETAVIADNVHLEDHLKFDKMSPQYEILTALDNIKTELSSFEVRNNMVNDNVKKEEGIIADNIKIEFDNGLLFCEDCHAYCQDYCTECEMLVHIMNKNTLISTDDRTRDELPDDILEIREPFGQFKIFTLRVIPKNVTFGPFTGFSTLERPWKTKGGKFVSREENSKILNWMQYINHASSISDQNLLPFQYEGNLYYQSTCEIQEGEELLLHFGEEYEESLNRNVEMDFIPIAKQGVRDVFGCTFCCLGFSSKAYLMRHKAICLIDQDKSISIEEIIQCSFCNIYLRKKEYIEHHMAYCCERNDGKRMPLVSEKQPTDRTGLLQMYKCSQCNYKTKYRCDLQSHTNQHQENKTYKCRMCCKPFTTKESLKVHLKNMHTNVEESESQKCIKGDASKYKKSKKANSEIQKKIEHLTEFRYNCMECDYRTNKKKNLTSHAKTKHLKEFKYKCELCEYKTNHKSGLNKHVQAKHLKEFAYNCEVCEFQTHQKQVLEIHVKTKHLKEFDYECEMCGYETNRKTHLDYHIKTRHLKAFDYKCEICQLQTNRKSVLERHIKSIHLKEFDYKCESCKFETNDKASLKAHIQTLHLKTFTYNCEICGYRTNRKPNLENHTKAKHLNESKYKCELCKYKTTHKTRLKIHVKSKHLKEFSYKCEICKYKTNVKLRLELHTKSKHLKEFNYECELCKYKTNWKKDLDYHMKEKHLEEFKYVCELCEYKTNRRSHLEYHVKAKHPKEFGYNCDIPKMSIDVVHVK